MCFMSGEQLVNRNTPKISKNLIIFIILMLAGILMNTCPYFVMYIFNFPLFLDSVGTIFTTIVAGPFFGVCVAVLGNFLSAILDSDTLYFSVVNALIAIYTAAFFKKHSIKKIRDILLYIFWLSIMVGVISAIIEWALTGATTESVAEKAAHAFYEATGFPYLIAVPILNVIINVVDKALCLGAAIGLIQLTPANVRELIDRGAARQRDISDEELSKIRSHKNHTGTSVRSRETTRLLLTSFLIIILMSWTGLRLFFNNSRTDKTENAVSTAKLASAVIEAYMIPTYLREGEGAPGYKETKDLLYQIRDSSSSILYLYVVKVEEDGYHFVFDLDTGDEVGIEPGRIVPFDDEIEPYIPKLLAGEEIEPMELNEFMHWVISVYNPIRDSTGKTMGYVICDVSLDYITAYMLSFVIRMLLIIAGLFIMIVAYELWMTSVYITYPITALTACVAEFSESGDDQKAMDENVRKLRSLEIETGDEIEMLYQTLCKMTLNQAEQMRNIRNLSESTLKMQDGLIITMADMVESRDSDTGAHVQKTAAYVKIIVEGLKRKGYYAEKITDKFISDCVRSAPLHDVGKINISDKILNKNGKLTDEEFEIMKTHTTAGKEIIEKAINTVKGGTYLKEARNMAAYHHERWDGKGYPEGLHGEVIPLSARIMAVADVFDALASPRVYKPPFPLEKAVEILKEGAGTQFDAKCVEVFLESLPEVKVILNKYHNM